MKPQVKSDIQLAIAFVIFAALIGLSSALYTSELCYCCYYYHHGLDCYDYCYYCGYGCGF